MALEKINPFAGSRRVRIGPDGRVVPAGAPKNPDTPAEQDGVDVARGRGANEGADSRPQKQ